MDTVVLFHPTGQDELALIRDRGWRAFPPRLPEQPIFYPVLDEEYAIQIARDWNTRDGDIGFVVKFSVEREYLSGYQVQTVGVRIHREYWIPRYYPSSIGTLLGRSRSSTLLRNPPTDVSDLILRSNYRQRVSESRVEMWRGGLGLTYLFPVLSSAGASLVGPCSVSTSRSSNRTCAINASGSRRKFTISPTRSGRYVSQARLTRRNRTGIYPGTCRFRVSLPCVYDTATNAAVCGRVDRSPDRPC